MTKEEVIDFFGGKQILVSEALGVCKQAISRWGNELTKHQEALVIYTAVKKKMDYEKLLPSLKY